LSEEGKEAQRRVDEERQEVKTRIRQLEGEHDRLELSQAMNRSLREERLKAQEDEKKNS
jgi:hypothetical protein